jgi:hypothetical protein
VKVSHLFETSADGEDIGRYYKIKSYYKWHLFTILPIFGDYSEGDKKAIKLYSSHSMYHVLEFKSCQHPIGRMYDTTSRKFASGKY